MANVTVIVPVYKVEEYLEKCYKSLLNQRYGDIEIVLVDDGSPDSSGAICDEFASAAEADGIPVYVIHQTNRGLSGARNSGIDWAMACSGSEWLCFVDSDDTVADAFIEKLYDAACANDADLAVCDFMEVDTEGKDIHVAHEFPCGVIPDNKQLFELMYENWRIHPAWNKLYHKHLFTDLRFDEGKLHEDEFIIHKVLYFSRKVVFISDMLYLYLIRQSGIMGTENRRTKSDAYQADIERYWFCKENNLPVDPRVLWLDYMVEVIGFHDELILCEYRKVYFDYPMNRTLKKWLQFQFGSIYRRYRKRRLG